MHLVTCEPRRCFAHTSAPSHFTRSSVSLLAFQRPKQSQLLRNGQSSVLPRSSHRRDAEEGRPSSSSHHRPRRRSSRRSRHHRGNGGHHSSRVSGGPSWGGRRAAAISVRTRGPLPSAAVSRVPWGFLRRSANGRTQCFLLWRRWGCVGGHVGRGCSGEEQWACRPPDRSRCGAGGSGRPPAWGGFARGCWLGWLAAASAPRPKRSWWM